MRGGRIHHIRRYLREHGWLMGTKYFFLMIGGNDLTDNLPTKVATDLEDLVFDLRQNNKDVVVITGTIIPRAGSCGNRSAFVDKCFAVDSLMTQWGLQHHHFLCDAFFADAGAGGPGGIREEFYIHDLVHLNKGGRDILLDLIEFLIMSVEKNNYSGNFGWGSDETARQVLWKF